MGILRPEMSVALMSGIVLALFPSSSVARPSGQKSINSKTKGRVTSMGLADSPRTRQAHTSR